MAGDVGNKYEPINRKNLQHYAYTRGIELSDLKNCLRLHNDEAAIDVSPQRMKYHVLATTAEGRRGERGWCPRRFPELDEFLDQILFPNKEIAHAATA